MKIGTMKRGKVQSVEQFAFRIHNNYYAIIIAQLFHLAIDDYRCQVGREMFSLDFFFHLKFQLVSIMRHFEIVDFHLYLHRINACGPSRF